MMRSPVIANIESGVKKISLKIVTVSLGVLLCAPIYGQQMYRCGSTYQDRPCDGAQPGKMLVGLSGGSSAQPSSSAPADLKCAQRGVDAEKIKWAREAGKTEEMQLSGTRDGRKRELITEVYARAGASGEVRAAVEAECLAEKERAAQAAGLMEAAAKLQEKDRQKGGRPVDPGKK